MGEHILMKGQKAKGLLVWEVIISNLILAESLSPLPPPVTYMRMCQKWPSQKVKLK